MAQQSGVGASDARLHIRVAVACRSPRLDTCVTLNGVCVVETIFCPEHLAHQKVDRSLPAPAKAT